MIERFFGITMTGVVLTMIAAFFLSNSKKGVVFKKNEIETKKTVVSTKIETAKLEAVKIKASVFIDEVEVLIDKMEPKTFYSLRDDRPGVHQREKFYMSIKDIDRFLRDPDFYRSDSIGNVRPQVQRYLEILLKRMRNATPWERSQFLTNHQVMAARLCESYVGGGKVNLHTSGDRNLRNKAFGDLQHRYDAWGEIVYDKGAYKLWKKDQLTEIKSLGIRSSDYHGNILLNYCTYQLWHLKYTRSSTNWQTRVTRYNAGPKGFSSTYYSKAGKKMAYLKAHLETSDVSFASITFPSGNNIIASN